MLAAPLPRDQGEHTNEDVGPNAICENSRAVEKLPAARGHRSTEAMSSALARARARKAEKERGGPEEELERGVVAFGDDREFF